MALDTKGTAHIFGIQAGVAAVTDATVQSFSESDSKQNISQTLNELGNEIERRSDDLMTEVNITLRIQSGYALPDVSDVLVYDSIKYDILTIESSETNGAHVVVTLTAKTTEYITLV
jgi:hypothetical protein